MREGRSRPSLSGRSAGRGVRGMRRNEGGAKPPLVALTTLDSSGDVLAAMREGRSRPSLLIPAVTRRHCHRRRNEGGAKPPLVARGGAPARRS